MRILRAEAMGLCFGVRDALDLAAEQTRPADVTIHGELVHNETVLERLSQRGFRFAPEARREQVPETDAVFVTAHGISDRARERLVRHGKQLIDSTCPLVRRAHGTAKQLSDDGYFVIVIGKPGHVEVRGLIGDLQRYDVVPSVERVAHYAHPRLGVVCQTTTPETTAAEILARIRALNPDAEVRFIDTICEPTRQRVHAVEELVQTADVIIVVGGVNSNNTAQLARMSRERGVDAHHVQGPDDLDPAWFDPADVVGLTAGTSTLDETIDAVEDALRQLSRAGRAR